MILDSLNNAEAYEGLHPLFKKAFDYLKSTDFVATQTGTVELEGRDLFVMISDSSLKTVDNARLEVHNKYIDIQMPVSQSETFGWKSRLSLSTPSDPFNEEKDIQFFADSDKTLIEVKPRNFLILYPQDGHAPCIGEGSVRKVVVKVKI